MRLWFAKTGFPGECGLLGCAGHDLVWPWEGLWCSGPWDKCKGDEQSWWSHSRCRVTAKLRITHIFIVRSLMKFLLGHHNGRKSLDPEQEAKSDPDLKTFSFGSLSKFESLFLDSCGVSLHLFHGISEEPAQGTWLPTLVHVQNRSRSLWASVTRRTEASHWNYRDIIQIQKQSGWEGLGLSLSWSGPSSPAPGPPSHFSKSCHSTFICLTAQARNPRIMINSSFSCVTYASLLDHKGQPSLPATHTSKPSLTCFIPSGHCLSPGLDYLHLGSSNSFLTGSFCHLPAFHPLPT